MGKNLRIIGNLLFRLDGKILFNVKRVILLESGKDGIFLSQVF